MQFTVPQFIEREAKLVGPFTFKQFIFVGTALGLCIFLFFVVPLWAFIIGATFLMGAALALAFVKIGKSPLPAVIKNFFVYIFGCKIYLWKKKPSRIKTFEKPKEKPEALIEKKGQGLKIAGSSHLEELYTRIETKNK